MNAIWLAPSCSLLHTPIDVDLEIKQRDALTLLLLPTTTIGSFPQTNEIRSNRRNFKNGTIGKSSYENRLKKEIPHVIKEQ